MNHTVEKIGGTSMLDYEAVRDNIVCAPGTADPYGRILVVSAYAGITNRLLEHKKSGRPGVFALFSSSQSDVEGSWRDEFDRLRSEIRQLNQAFFPDEVDLARANRFIEERIVAAVACLESLEQLCGHGHFSLDAHLATVREMLASIGTDAQLRSRL